MTAYTPNLRLAKPAFDATTWHDDVNGNFDILDAQQGTPDPAVGMYNILNYGAIAGTDSTTAIQEAINDACSVNGAVYIPAATEPFYHTGLVIPANADRRKCDIIGAACNMESDYSDDVSGSMLFLMESSNVHSLTVYEGNHVRIENVYMNGKRHYQQGGPFYGIYLPASGSGHKERSLTLRNCRIDGMRGSAIWAATVRSAVFMERCLIHYAGVFTTGTAQAASTNTITLESSGNIVDNAYQGCTVAITAGTGAGQTATCSAYNGTTKLLTVSTNWSVTPSTDSVYEVYINGDGFTASSSFDHRIIGCDFGNCSRYGINLSNSGAQITSCDVYGNERAGINISSDCIGVRMTAVMFDGNKGQGLITRGSSTNNDIFGRAVIGCRFNGNGLRSDSFSEIKAIDEAGLSVIGCEFLTHKASISDHYSRYLIETSGNTRRVQFIGNSFDYGEVESRSTDSFTPSALSSGDIIAVTVTDASEFASSNQHIVLERVNDFTKWISGNLISKAGNVLTVEVQSARDDLAGGPYADWYVSAGRSYVQAVTNTPSALIGYDGQTELNVILFQGRRGEGRTTVYNDLALSGDQARAVYDADSGSADDGDKWYTGIEPVSRRFRIRAMNDAEDNSIAVMEVGRTGFTVPYIALGGEFESAMLRLIPSTTPVNLLQISNADTGDAVTLTASGADTNIDIDAIPKGTGRLLAGSKRVLREHLSDYPTYADNATAILGGLAVGEVYRTATGQLMIRY